MTEQEKLQRDIDALRTSIRLGWVDMDRLTISREDRRDLREHIKWCMDELKGLLERLEAEDA